MWTIRVIIALDATTKTGIKIKMLSLILLILLSISITSHTAINNTLITINNIPKTINTLEAEVILEVGYINPDQEI